MSTLVSPGVSVTVIDQSQYASSGAGTVPLIFVATKANKLGTDGVTITSGTQTSGVMTLLTSQLDLVTQFGTPTFDITDGTVNQGSEISEYGLKAAFDYLGIANRAYVVRADVDLSQLAYSETAPTGSPANGTYWFNLNTTSFGLFRANGNATPGLAWTAVTPVIPTASDVDSNFVPLTTFGSNGNIAVVTLTTNNAIYEKVNGAWYLIGSNAWIVAHGPTVALGTVVNPVFTMGSTINIDGTSVTLSGTTVSSTASDITGANIPNITASVVNNKLQISDSTGASITIAAGAAATAAGIASASGYNFVYAPHTSVPVGTHSGDIWIKTTNPNYGANYVVEVFNSSLNQFATVTAPFYANDAAASAGYGSALGIGSLYVQYNTLSNNTATQVIKRYDGSQWDVLSYVASTTAPTTPPADGTLWISNEFLVDIMVNTGNTWEGYLNKFPATDPNGVQITSAQPTTQSTGNPLADQDLWLNSADVVNYPALYRYSASSNSWTLIDKTDLTTPFGIVFADARANADGSATGSTEVTDMLVSNFVDPDAPNPETYPAGLLLFNTRYSTYNVKSYDSTKFLNEGAYTVGAFQGNVNSVTGTVANPVFTANSDAIVINGNTVAMTGTNLVQAIVDINNAGLTNIVASDTNNKLTITNLANTTITIGGSVQTIAGLATTTGPVPALSAARWVTASGNDVNGTPFMGRFAQHQMVVLAIRALVESNDDIRSEFNFFNLLTAPGYPEVIADLQALNVDRKETAFIIADTPMHLKPDATSLNNWATNTANVAVTNEFGRTTLYAYAAEYYPQGLGTDSLGNSVAIPASSVALCTYGYNDSVAYPWYSPAGTQRGIVQNASSVGYVDPVTNLFTTVTLNQGQRDTLYTNDINPIAFLPNRGLIVYGDKTLSPDTSALDRINVARLICYLRSDLDALAQPFLFQLNTESTRNSVESVFSRHLGDLLSLQAITDFAVVCDTTNNTPETIDANELWIDIAIFPSKSINFIYIPIRIMNTGTI